MQARWITVVDPLLGSGPQTTEEWRLLHGTLSNRGVVFSLRSQPRCYKQDNWSNKLVVR
jgi:hypothetical protein